MKYIESGKEYQEHIIWIKSKSYIKEITNIWEQQRMRYCPNWGNGGRKDEKWTHITCNKCKHMFCYFWGLSLDIADNSDPDGSIFGHNDRYILIDQKLL